MAEATEMRSGLSGDVEDIATLSVSAVQGEKEWVRERTGIGMPVTLWGAVLQLLFVRSAGLLLSRSIQNQKSLFLP
jgi:hypothetical protein